MILHLLSGILYIYIQSLVCLFYPFKLIKQFSLGHHEDTCGQFISQYSCLPFALVASHQTWVCTYSVMLHRTLHQLVRSRARCQDGQCYVQLLRVDAVQLGNFPRVPEVVIVNIPNSLEKWDAGMVLELCWAFIGKGDSFGQIDRVTSH